MRRSVMTLLATALACAAVTVVAVASNRPRPARVATLSVARASHADGGFTVASPTRAVKAEMDRRQGTPRAAFLAWRRRAREIARIKRRLAALRAAERAAALRRLAALRAAQAASPWYDAAGATAIAKPPTSNAEKQWVDS